MSESDIILIPLVLGIVMTSVYIAYTVLDEIDSIDDTISSTYLNLGKDALKVFDAMIIFIVVSIGIGALIVAASVRTHPAFSVVSMLLLAIFVCISAWLANAYYAIQNAPQFAAAANEMDNFVKLNNMLPLIVAVLGVAILIATYAKPWEQTNLM